MRKVEDEKIKRRREAAGTIIQAELAHFYRELHDHVAVGGVRAQESAQERGERSDNHLDDDVHPPLSSSVAVLRQINRITRSTSLFPRKVQHPRKA
jgi:hypothetical protein